MYCTGSLVSQFLRHIVPIPIRNSTTRTISSVPNELPTYSSIHFIYFDISIKQDKNLPKYLLTVCFQLNQLDGTGSKFLLKK